jgi:hypothetical protein
MGTKIQSLCTGEGIGVKRSYPVGNRSDYLGNAIALSLTGAYQFQVAFLIAISFPVGHLLW